MEGGRREREVTKEVEMKIRLNRGHLDSVCTSLESGLPSFNMSATDFSSGSFICME